MGDIADSMINGEMDCCSGEYLGKPRGYPRTRCYPKRSGVQYGRNYQSNKSKVWRMIFVKGNPSNLSHTQIVSIIREYIHGELKLPKDIKEKTAYKHILRDEERFKTWYATNYPNHAKYLQNG